MARNKASIGESADEIILSDAFGKFVETLSANHIHHDDVSKQRLAKALAWAQRIREERGLGDPLPGDLNFADPLKLATSLAQYSNTDSPSIIAALLYSSLRDVQGRRPQQRYFRKIKKEFGQEVHDIVKETLDIANVRVPDLRQVLVSDADEAAEQLIFDHILKNRTKHPPDERALLIRLTEWRFFTGTRGLNAEKVDQDLLKIGNDQQKLQEYLKQFDGEKIADYYWRNQLFAPSRSDIAKTRNLYVPLAELFHLRLTRSHLGDEWLRLAHPREYVGIRAKILAARQVLENAEKEGKPIEGKILDKLGPEWAGRVEVETRVKSAASIYENRLRDQAAGRTSSEDLSDIIGYRLIINTDGLNEKAAVAEVHRVLTAAFPQVAGRYKDYVNNPKENGYRAIHDGFKINGDDSKRIEIQFVSRGMYVHNEGSPSANHVSYNAGKNSDVSKGFRTAAKEVGPRMVTIFTKDTPSGVNPFWPQDLARYPDSRRYKLRFGSTAADMLRFLKKGRAKDAFRVAKIEIERGSSFRILNPAIDELGFNQLLASSDEIQLRTDRTLLHDPEHRLRIIAAVTDKKFKKKLLRAHKWLSRWENAGIGPRRTPPKAASQPALQNNAA